MYRLNVLLAVAVALGLVLAGCDSGGGIEESGPETIWEETFESGTGNWTTDETAGPMGWCGDIARVGADEGSVAPSNGSGYATAALGPCNDFYTENGFPNGSGPFGPFGEYNDAVGFEGNTGFVQELDVYLDPSVSAPDTTVFTYAATFDLLDTEFPDNFRYALIPVVKPDETLLVAGEAITEAGWYTFRHRMTSEEGALALDFELVRNGDVLATQNVTTTGFSGEEVSSFEVSNVGTGYAWFVVIRPGLQLPIDEQELFRMQ